MNRGRLSFVVFVVSFAVIAGPGPASVAGEPSGYWAKAAVPFMEVGDERRLIFPSPNGRSIVLIDGPRVWVRVDRRVRHLNRDVGLGWPAEIAWAPDSSAFFITQTNDGLDGPWSSRIFLVGRDGVHVVDPARNAVGRFRAQQSCAPSDVPNVAAAAWLDGAKRLLIVTEVPPRSSCAQTGKAAGYVVAIPSAQVERELTGEALHREFRARLGPRVTVR